MDSYPFGIALFPFFYFHSYMLHDGTSVADICQEVLYFCLIHVLCLFIHFLIDESLNLEIEITTSLSVHVPYRMFIFFL